MAKLTRQTAKIFGETASTTGSNPAISQFGSGKAGTYLGTGDIATIQQLSAWLNGWTDAVTPTQQFPALPEMTGVQKVLSYQSAYLLQEGIAEYDANTTYFTGSICKQSGTFNIYGSITDNNTGNALTDTTNWQFLADLGNLGGEYADQDLSNLSYPIGETRLQGAQYTLNSCKLYENGKADLLSSDAAIATVQSPVFNSASNAQNGVDGVSMSPSSMYAITINSASTQPVNTDFIFDFGSGSNGVEAVSWASYTIPDSVPAGHLYNVYGSTDGTNWTLITATFVISPYNFSPNNYRYIKAQVSSAGQPYARAGIYNLRFNYKKIVTAGQYLNFNVSSTDNLTLTNKNQTRQLSSLASVDVSNIANGAYTPFVLDTNSVELISNYKVQPNAALENEATSANAISSTPYSGQPATNAFDGNLSTFWGSQLGGANIINIAYIGNQNLTRPVKKAIMYQGNTGGTTNYCSTLKFQYSNDGSNWVDIQEITNGANLTWQEWILPNYTPTGATHSFRVLASGGFSGSSGNNWIVPELQLYSLVENSVRLDNSTLPLKLLKVVDSAEVAYNATPMTGAEVTVTSGVITAVKQPQLNQNGVVFSTATPARYQIETYKNGYNWYVLYSDGWIEQGGKYQFPNGAVSTITFLKPFTTNNVNLLSSLNTYFNGTGIYLSEWGYNPTATYFQCNGHSNRIYSWRACGY